MCVLIDGASLKMLETRSLDMKQMGFTPRFNNYQVLHLDTYMCISNHWF